MPLYTNTNLEYLFAYSLQQVTGLAEPERGVICMKANKPNYEIGTTMPLKLSFAKKPALAPAEGASKDVAAVWALSADDMLDDDLDLIDSDELLDDVDLKKPDPASLRGE